MDWILLILFMVFIGALIGGFTNFIAIRMLFRPYRPFFIGKWQLPFTPGLIPKRQNELAEQIGKLVVNHLVSPESIQRKLSEPKFKYETEAWLNDKINSWLNRQYSLEQLLEDQMQIQDPIERIRFFIHGKIDKKYKELKGEFWQRQISDIVPETLKETIKGKIPEATDQILQKAIEYFSSLEGKDKIKTMIEDFLKSRGRLWNMIQMFIGNDSLADKFQPEVIKFLNNPGTKELLVNVLDSEWEKIQTKPIGEFFAKLDEEKILTYAKQFVDDSIQVEQWLKKPIQSHLQPYEDYLQKDIVPKILDKIGQYLSDRSKEILVRFQVEAIVREQIESFSLRRLEELVISIAKKELVMITYLGAILGGAIGLIQGIIVSFTS